jgi:predicted amidohydrolase YtcJ
MEIFSLDSSVIYPGFIDAHCHFFYYGKTRIELNLKEVSSLKELEERTQTYGEKYTENWIIGRGWNETTWTDSQEVHNRGLNEMFPNRPVILSRVDGHSVLVNDAALKAAGYTANDSVPGGHIVTLDGVMTGVLVDAAADKVKQLLPEISNLQAQEALVRAQNDCFGVGLTTVADAGLPLDIMKLIQTLAGKELLMRIYAMSNPGPEEFEYFAEKGKIDDPYFKVRSVKMYGDGSLGSKSAWLKDPYCGEKGNHGLPQSDVEYFREVCEKTKAIGFQLNTHCIGDSANSVLLNLYGSVIGAETNHRCRIEQAQIE